MEAQGCAELYKPCLLTPLAVADITATTCAHSYIALIDLDLFVWLFWINSIVDFDIGNNI
jgi:hypothetical protein